MSTQLNKLQTLLRELFQLDQADLDFGIYRIMALKRDEITRFLEHDLLPQVRAAFGQFRPADKAHTEQQLHEAIATAQGLGYDPDQSPKVQELREKLNQAVDVAKLEADVYDHLYDFFRRYYKDGDFISLRRYKEGVYAIPYEGEEVKLYWANHDQYYIKTTETLTSYAFKAGDGRRVRFELAAATAERDNVKPAAGQERRFLLHEDAPVDEDAEGLVVRFEYRPDDQGRKQAELNDLAAQGILDTGPAGWRTALAELAPTGANPQRTVLDKHIATYTARNTFDYFIHKDLGGFLRRELDFYIKNEVLHLDDIDDADMAQIEQALSLVKALRQIAHKLIDFLASIEDFQKRLWLKKKFVVETNWCVTLDHIPEEFYPEIVANDAQWEEWVRLFAIDQIRGDLVTPAYSVPLTEDFLRANPYLVLDTRFFTLNFVERLLVSLDALDEQTDGLLVHSENFQALRLLTARYREQVKCIYIDPPYNTDAGPILYKNDYRSSSWMSLMADRVRISRSFLADNGVLCVTIDDYEQKELHFLLEQEYGSTNRAATVAIRSNPSGRPVPSGFAQAHEYAIFFTRTTDVGISKLPRTTKQAARYRHQDDSGGFMWELFRKRGSNSERKDRPSLYYPIYVLGERVRVPQLRWDDDGRVWNVLEQPARNEQVVYPIDDSGTERTWRGQWRNVAANPTNYRARTEDGDATIYYKFRPRSEGVLPLTIWIDAKYSATEHGTGLLKHYFSEYGVFSYPKSIYAVEDSLRVAGLADEQGTACDFFAGSGTTGHAVINLNREDDGNRVYVLVETSDYFDTVLKPRIQKVIYSTDWRDGKPVSRQGSSHMFKYLRLESYEDTLDNLAIQRIPAQKFLLDAQREAREDFMLHYLLDIDTRSSPSLLDVQRFANPFDYKLKITRHYEQQTVNVDLVETFNYLIGLRVDHMAPSIHRTADFERDEHGRLVVKDGRTHVCKPGESWSFRTVQGHSPAGENVLVVWRTLSGDPEQDNAMLDLLFARMDIRPRDQEFDVIYINGDNNLENLRRPDETWKVRLIEEDFHRLMWDVQDV